MSFDVALGMDETTLGQVMTAIFNRPSLRTKLFSGSEPIDAGSIKASVSYELESPPVVKLSPPTAEQWKRAIKADGNSAQPAENAMIVTLPKLKLTRPDETGHAQEGVVSLDAIVTVNLQNNTLTYNALAVIIDLSAAKPLDQIIYKKIVIPRALKAIDGAFGQPHIPNIAFNGLSFGSVILEVGDGRIVGVANLAHKPAPGPQPLAALPREPFFILLSREGMQIACQAGSADLVGKTAEKSGSESFGVGNASYRGSVRLDAISVQVANDPTVVNASIAVSASASAGISVLDTIIGGIKTGANAVADAAKTAGNAIASGATTAVNAIAHAFHGY
jgi:hypothetical protein